MLPKGEACGDPSRVVKGVPCQGGVSSKFAPINEDLIMVVE